MVRPSRPFQLLIADDDVGFRETLRDIFSPQFATLEACCGEEAVELSTRHRIDIALLDMHMQLLTGLEALRAIKTINAIIPCILITAEATDELRKSAAEADAFDVLSKPVDKGTLVETVSTALVNAYDVPRDDSSPYRGGMSI